MSLNRREFMKFGGGALLGAAWNRQAARAQSPTAPSRLTLAWHRHADSGLFEQVTVDGRLLVDPAGRAGLLDGFCALVSDGKVGPEVRSSPPNPRGSCGPVRMALRHELRRIDGAGHENLLEATLDLRNESEQAYQLQAGFITAARPNRDTVEQQIYIPLSAAALGDAPNDPRGRLKDCHQRVTADGFLCHYLEPQGSDLRAATTRAALLAPVVDLFAEGGPSRVALFGASTEPVCFEAAPRAAGGAWRSARLLHLKPGQTHTLKLWLLLHSGDAGEAWSVFQRIGHQEDFPALAWPGEVEVHYYDFLSGVKPDGPRGGGYDLDLSHFREFHVGLATQHGYYLACGDYIHPDRKEWKAMPTDAAGPVTMTLEQVKARVDATRQAGTHPAIYMHYTILDEGSPLFEQMRDSILVDAQGKPTVFGWVGPDTITKTWRMSTTAPQWRAHLVQQARWIMEMWNPDAIVLDETFSSWGFDHHKQHGGLLSQGGIALMRELRQTVRSYGKDKALFASDCSMGNFCMWGDGEAGDHCYDRLLGQELYRKPPIRYMAALGNKPWLQCAWLYKSLWPVEVDLARKVGAALGVTNGWGDNLGLTHLPPETKKQMLADIEALSKTRRGA